MNDFEIIPLHSCPELIPKAAQWFHEKWDVPLQAYIDSMTDSLSAKGAVPSWYVMTDGDNIIAGLGVIENDFHKRPDLAPNICAVYVEEAYRGRKFSERLLDRALNYLHDSGIESVYLITGHNGLYEKFGWSFYGMVEENDGNMIRMYYYDNGRTKNDNKNH